MKTLHYCLLFVFFTATYVQAQTPVTTTRGNMYSFEGTNQYIDLGMAPCTALNTTNKATLQAWIKLDAASSTTLSILESNDDVAAGNFLSLEIPGGTRGIRFFATGGFVNTVSNTVIPVGEWVHCTGVYDPTESNMDDRLKIYINGRLQATTRSGTPSNSLLLTDEFYIGSEKGIRQYWKGAQDEVRIWDRALTQAEIREQMHLTLTGTEAGLVSYYQFNSDAVAGTIGGVKDVKGTADGTTVNMVSADNVPSEVAVAGGVVERQNITSIGMANFSTANVSLNFVGNVNGEVVVSRLTTESPTGANSLPTTKVAGEYLVVWNYGVGVGVSAITVDNIGPFLPTTANTDVYLYERGARAFGNTWGTALSQATTAFSPAGSIATFAATTTLTANLGQYVLTYPEDTTVSIHKIQQSTNVEIYPNPTQGNLTIKVPDNTTTQAVKILLIDAWGRQVRATTATLEANQALALPNLLRDLPKACYYLSIQTLNGRQQWNEKVLLH